MARHFELEAIPDMTGKVAIVTGASNGIGKVCAQELAKKGAHTFLACRTESKAIPIVEEIKKSTGNEKVELLLVDLLSLESVKHAADTFKSKGLPLHLLINNAGITTCPWKISVDGIESQFATNHVAHFYFTTLLLPILESSAPSRVVNVSSVVHRLSPSRLKLDEVNDKAKYKWRAYCRSKLSNILFTVELNRRLVEHGVKNVYVNANHPGTSNTGLIANAPFSLASLIVGKLSFKPEDGAITQMYLATSPEVEEKDIRAKYYVPFAVPSNPSSDAQDPELAKELWEFTENLLKEKIPGYQGAGI